MEEELIELKGDPCPYCGHDFCTAELYKMSKGIWSYSICCPKCQTGGPFIPESEGVGIAEVKAIEAWNALPRRLKWTREKPTKTDFYWHKDGKMLRIGEIMELSGSLFCHFAGENEPQLLDLIDGEWAGPIPEPTD